jgi:thiol-disulfide isomerase/thioredoxin
MPTGYTPWSRCIMKTKYFWAAAALLGAIWFVMGASEENQKLTRPMTAPGAKLSLEGELPSLDQATAWLNSQPLSATDLRGKVVLVQFWTYTCINWRRTLPYVRTWAKKYKDQGLVVIGVHTPEFSFEKDIDNVRRAANDQGVDYPIAIDSKYAIWRGFDNHYWPALYFVDAQGRIRRHHFGEGDYDRSEMTIQQLLTEAGRPVPDRTLVSVDPSGAELQADWRSLESPETYLGYERTGNFASSVDPRLDRAQVYVAPERLRLNQWGLSGNWTMRGEFVVLNKASGTITYRFHARDLHLIMGTASQEKPVRFRVRIDGQPPGASHGVDVDESGNGTVTEPRMYQLIRQRAPISDQQFEIEFLDPGAQAFAFTFG